MAKQEKVSFYLYNDEGVIYTKTKRISSPYNVASFNPRDPKFDTYRNPKYVTFEKGIYETDDEEEIKWLDMYNIQWGTIEVKIDGEIIKKKVSWDGIHVVKRDLPPERRNETIIEKEVEVQQIPRIIAEKLTIEQLKELCSTWSVTVDWAIKKEDYIKFLAESGKLS